MYCMDTHSQQQKEPYKYVKGEKKLKKKGMRKLYGI